MGAPFCWEGHVWQGKPACSQESCGLGLGVGVGCLVPTERTVVCSEHFPGWFASNFAFLLEICRCSWESPWAQRAVLTSSKIVPGTLKKALDWESGDLGLILVPPVTHGVALWLNLDSDCWGSSPSSGACLWVT